MQLNSILKLQPISVDTTLKNKSLFNSTGTNEEHQNEKNGDTCNERLSIHLHRFECILNVIGSAIQIEVSRIYHDDNLRSMRSFIQFPKIDFGGTFNLLHHFDSRKREKESNITFIIIFFSSFSSSFRFHLLFHLFFAI